MRGTITRAPLYLLFKWTQFAKKITRPLTIGGMIHFRSELTLPSPLSYTNFLPDLDMPKGLRSLGRQGDPDEGTVGQDRA